MSAPSTHATPEGSGPQGVVPQDLSREGLLAQLPRDADNRPLLGGIPLSAKLGQGGMGAVYYGIHPRLHNEVAVKVLPFHLADKNPILIKRFFAEARVAARVKSPHIVNVMDVNEDEGVFYLVMEYIDGLTAAQLLRKIQSGLAVPPIDAAVPTVAAVTPPPVGEGPPPPSGGLPEWAALEICIGAAEGLCSAHAYDVVHRDVKPDNVLVPRVRSRGVNLMLDLRHAKLADLGLAKPEDSNSIGTISQLTMGTPGYMAPEQIRDAKRASKPSDVFSLGATLYALLAGRSPFTGNSVGDLLVKTITEPHADLRSFRPDVTDVTYRLVEACLAKNPADRFNDGAELLEALHLAAGGVTYPSAVLRALGDPRQSGSRTSRVGSGVTPSPAPSAAASAVAASAAGAHLAAGGNEAKTPPDALRTPVAAQAVAAPPPVSAASAREGALSTALVASASARERAAARLELTPPEPLPPVQIATATTPAPPPKRISKQPPVVPDSLPDLQYSARVSRALSQLLRAQPGQRHGPLLWVLSVALILVAAGAAGWWFGFEAPRRAAQANYDTAITQVRLAESQALGAEDAQSEKASWQAVLAACQQALNARPTDPDAKAAQQNAVGKLDQVSQEIKRSAELFRDAMAEAAAADEESRQAADLAARLAQHKLAQAAYLRALRARPDDPAARAGKFAATTAVDRIENQLQALQTALQAGAEFEKQAAAAGDSAARVKLLTQARDQYQAACDVFADPAAVAALERLNRRLPVITALQKGTEALLQGRQTTDPRQRLSLFQFAAATLKTALAADPGDTAIAAAHSQARLQFAREYFGGFLEVRRLDPYAGRPSRDNLLGFDLSPDQLSLALVLPGSDLQVWSPAAQKLERTIATGEGLVLDARFLTDDLLATASSDGAARLWRRSTGEPVRLLHPPAQTVSHAGPVKFLVASADAKWLLTAADDRTVRVWEIETGRLAATLAGHADWIASADFSADGRRVLTASHDTTARLWNAQTGEIIREFKGHTGKLYRAVFDPVLPRVLTVSADGTARIWNANTGEPLLTLNGHAGAVLWGAFSADGKRVVTASSDHTARVWDAHTADCLFVLSGHTELVNRVRFCLDDTLVLTTAFDNTVRVWDLEDGSLLTTLSGHVSPVFDARLTADGLSIFSVGDHTVREWSNPLLTVAGRAGAATPDDAYRLALHDAAQAEAVARQVADDPFVARATWERVARAWDRALRMRPGDAAALAARAAARAKAAAISEQVNRRDKEFQSLLATARAAQAEARLAAAEDAKAGQAWLAWNRASAAARAAQVLKPADESAAALLAESAVAQLTGYYPRLTEVARFEGLTEPVEALAFAADGLTLATAGQDAAVRLWDARTRKQTALLEGHKAWPNSLQFSPDGGLLVSSDNITVRLWDPAKGVALRVLDEPNEAATALGPAGKLLYTLTAGGALRSWDTQTGRPVASVEAGPREIARLVFSPDHAQALAQLADHSLRLLDGATLRPVCPLVYTADAPVSALAIDPAHRIALAACMDGQVRRWQMADGRPLPPLTGHRGVVNFVTISPDGELVLTGGEDRTARLYAAATGVEVAVLFGHGDGCVAGAFSPDGRAVAIASGRAVHLWCNPQDDNQPLCPPAISANLYAAALKRAAAEEAALPALAEKNLDAAMRAAETTLACYQAARAVHPNDLAARAGVDSTRQQWEGWRGRLDQYDLQMQTAQAALEQARQARLSGDDPAPFRQTAINRFQQALTLNPGDPRATSQLQAAAQSLESNPFDTWRAIHATPALTAPVSALRFAGDGRALVAGQNDGTVVLVDLASGKLRRFADHTETVTAVDVSPDGATFASASLDQTVRVVSVETGATLHILRHKTAVRCLAFSPTGKTVITGGADGVARLWDTATGTAYKELTEHRLPLTAVQISRDGDHVLTASEDRTVKLWDLLNGRVLRRCEGHTGAVYAAGYSFDGKRLFSVSADNTARLWAAADGKLQHKLEGHTDPVVAGQFLPNGKALVTGGVDKTVRIWDALSGTLYKTLAGSEGAVRAVAVSPDGKTIASSGDDKILRLWADPDDKTNPLLFNK